MARFCAYLAAAVLGFITLFASPCAMAESPEDLMVVANRGIPVEKISVSELRSIFLKKKLIWSGGDKIEPINAESGTLLRQIFSVEVLGMSHGDELRYWQDQAVKHSITKPIEIKTGRHERLRKVFSTRGAISYVRRKDLLVGVAKVLLVIERPGPG